MALSAKNLQEIRRLNGIFLQADLYGELYEEITLAIYSSVLGPGDCAVDCGMNIGDHTRVMARLCGSTGSVYSFEAAPATMIKAKGNLQIFDNIKFFQKAASSQGGRQLSFKYSEFAHGLSSLKFENEDYSYETIEVETVALDDVVEDHISLMKLDIEGGEFDALRGAAKIIKRDLPVIIFENDLPRAAKEYGYSKDDFFGFFEGLGYQIYTIAGTPVLPEFWAVEYLPFQFLALHPHSPRLPSVFATIQYFTYRIRNNICREFSID